MAPVLVPIFQMAPVPNIFKVWHRWHVLNGTCATPLPNWYRCQLCAWHQCHSFSNLAPVLVCQMAPGFSRLRMRALMRNQFLLKIRQLMWLCRSCGHKSRAIFVGAVLTATWRVLRTWHQWRCQLKICLGSQMFDLGRATVGYLCLGRRFWKHKMTKYVKYFGRNGPLAAHMNDTVISKRCYCRCFDRPKWGRIIWFLFFIFRSCTSQWRFVVVVVIRRAGPSPAGGQWCPPPI